ncbi:glycosyltransferase [Acinetobacter gerneri]|uniref:Glycosyl transferase family 1 domain-containing protein n=2 Tax=Acinetobacter gerneri TaxID=202952 RepID=N8ZVX6_9GAMM|nr:glycosyltransferase [Acinetobacter gerneri]ENV35615.1 hypothetical protein F960_00129 [Acinetobacter gerneri DSM 14967 = CIP 107464 = MTCC 9824]EPR81408.1 putative glycosyltransferase protein [Acinetobacter gerneri DSM 14967 = CIP 107464 = MTCC 9824]MDQ9011998.1 glycosyltransferase [Acinetobacter gerneri]MDQ9016221.1 glycosyltransferase [Acinetobacter gerneri]MDQ9027277.1 glycosyltransferase [Acinetobacter gerneri]
MFFFLSAGIGEKLTGIEHAILKRKHVFDSCSLAHKIVTLNYNANYLKNLNIHHIRADSFLNLYDDYQYLIFAALRSNTLEDYLSHIAGEVTLEKNNANTDVKVYINGNYLFYIHFFSNGNISYINYFDKARTKFKRALYTESGYLSKEIYLEKNQVKSCLYYNQQGIVVLEEHYTQDNQLSYLSLKESNGSSCFFQDRDQWIKHWFQKIITSYKQPVFYVDKNRLYNHILVELKSPAFKLISIFHSVHVSNPQKMGDGRINSNYKISLAETNKFDGYIVSTEQQRQDLWARFGSELKIWVIPPTFAHIESELTVNAVASPFNVISVGRYYVEKRLHHIIQAVEILKEKYPEIQLDLYGFGDSRDNFIYEKEIRKYVDDHDLETNVHFKGYVHNISDKIRNAHVSVVASTIEGFCIGILDSLSVGTPVVAYDIRYGPNALIEQNLSGVLVENENIQALAIAIEQCYLNPHMRTHAIKSAKKYDLNGYKKKWLDHLLELSYV